MVERFQTEKPKERIHPIVVRLPDRTVNKIKALATSRGIDFETEFYNIFSKGLTIEEAGVAEIQKRRDQF
jgi:hypothetical protein